MLKMKTSLLYVYRYSQSAICFILCTDVYISVKEHDNYFRIYTSTLNKKSKQLIETAFC